MSCIWNRFWGVELGADLFHVCVCFFLKTVNFVLFVSTGRQTKLLFPSNAKDSVDVRFRFIHLIQLNCLFYWFVDDRTVNPWWFAVLLVRWWFADCLGQSHLNIGALFGIILAVIFQWLSFWGPPKMATFLRFIDRGWNSPQPPFLGGTMAGMILPMTHGGTTGNPSQRRARVRKRKDPKVSPKARNFNTWAMTKRG